MKIFLLVLLLIKINYSYAQIEQRFFCTDGNYGYRLFLYKNMTLEAFSEDSTQKATGKYLIKDQKISLDIPLLKFKETSNTEEWGKDLLLTFSTPQLFCHSTAHKKGPAVNAYAKCPTIRVIPSLSYEENAFEFFPNHMVKWRSWKEILKVPDTLYSEHFGIYLIEGKKFFLFFGDKKDDRLLTGTILNSGEQITIDQLEPQKGPCQIN